MRGSAEEDFAHILSSDRRRIVYRRSMLEGVKYRGSFRFRFTDSTRMPHAVVPYWRYTYCKRCPIDRCSVFPRSLSPKRAGSRQRVNIFVHAVLYLVYTS